MNQPSETLHVGARIVTRHMVESLSPGCSGTIVTVFHSAPGFYEVRMDVINAHHVMHASDLEPLREQELVRWPIEP
jgi:hypothetical protein